MPDGAICELFQEPAMSAFENGVQRNIVVANCTSMLTGTAHFDTHQPVENITFIGCVAIGGMPAASEAYGFQMRGRNCCSIIGCSVLQAIGRGVMLFGPASSGALIVGNMIANIKAIDGKNGVGIYLAGPQTLDSTGSSNHTISGNVIKNCEGSAIGNGGFNNDIVISGNVIQNTNSVVPAAAIQLTDATRILITGNNIADIALNPAIAMAGSSDNWQILQNSFSGAGSVPVSLSRSGSIVTNNSGYNPVGNIPDPWPRQDGELTNNVVSGNPGPQSGTSYTVRHSAKTIILTGGDVSQIAVNGVNTGLTAGVFKLGVGETIAVTYDTLVPATAVFAE
jgi:parallel beta helix pectate lyase-like protein